MIIAPSFLNKYSHVNWALADQAMVSGVNFFTGLMVARFLGMDQFGSFTLVWMAVLFINSIQMAMVGSPMMSIGPKQSEADEDSYYNAVMLQQLLFTLATFVLIFSGVRVSVVFMPEWGIDGVALPLAFSGAFFQAQDFLRRYFFCRQRALDAFWNDAVSYLGQLVVLGVAFYMSDMNVRGVLWVIGLTSACAVVLGLARTNVKLPEVRFFIKVLDRHWAYAKWITLSTLLQWGAGNLVFILTGGILGPASVGVLKASQNIMAFSHILFQAMENFVPVKASKIYAEHGLESLKMYKNKVVLFGGAATAALALMIAIFADELLLLAYADEYEQYGYVLRWFSIIYIFMYLGFPYRAVLRALEKTKSIFESQMIPSVFVVTSGYLIIKSYGLQGALATFLLTYIFTALYLHYSFSKEVCFQAKDV